MGLNGKTPAEACGITIQGENKWNQNPDSERKQKVKVIFEYAYKMASIMKVITFFLS